MTSRSRASRNAFPSGELGNEGIRSQGVSAFTGANGVNATLGFRVKSGWAAAVLLAGPVESPQLIDRRIVQLCDPTVPQSKQPYHAKMGTLQTDDAKVERLRKVSVKAAQDSVSELMKDSGSLRDFGS